jgi:tRNA 2-selenouridine synthase
MRDLVVLSGHAGAGKTAVLRALARGGAQVIDLEALACHRGSAFGGLGQAAQPSHRDFQAQVAAAWSGSRPDAPLFIEEEGEYLGGVGVPPTVLLRMRAAVHVLIDTPSIARVSRLAREYRRVPAADLAAAIRRLVPRIGHSTATAALDAVTRHDTEAAVTAVLPFYDRAYAHRFTRTGSTVLGRVDGTDADRAAKTIAHIAGLPAFQH